MEDLSGLQRDLLIIIAGLEKPYGLAIKSEIQEYYGSKIYAGQLYQNLDVIVERGVVEKGEIDGRTNFYALTSEGERDIKARREWEDHYLHDILNGRSLERDI